MSADWFFRQPVQSRSAIENDLRLSFWMAGFKQMWFTCIKDQSPFECVGLWHGIDFTIEWEPKNYLILRMKEANQDLLNAFQTVLKHSALAAYKNGNGKVVVEWRAKNQQARFQELQASGASNLERIGN